MADTQSWGSDFLADLLAAYGHDVITFMPGASFRGLEESIVNYRDNSPRVIEVLHEGISVSIAHGYAKASGSPGLCVLHDVVGTMHGTMGLYNAYCDAVPLVALSGTGPVNQSNRRPWIDWIHTAQVQGNLVREFVKWDDQPAALNGIALSIARAHKIANTPPCGPVYITIDQDLQEMPLDGTEQLPDPEAFAPPSSIAPAPAAIERAAQQLLEADQPTFVVGTLGDHPEAVESLVQLADVLGAAVVDPRLRRFNFPNTHPSFLPPREGLEHADVLIGLDLQSLGFTLKSAGMDVSQDILQSSATYIDIGVRELETSSLTTDYGQLVRADIDILADTRLAVPALLDAVRDRMDTSAHELAAERTAQFAETRQELRARWYHAAEASWDEAPTSLPRLAMELWEVVANDPWVLVNGNLRGTLHRYWPIDEFDQYVGSGSGGGGVGYGIGAAIGAALAYEDDDRIPINIQPDGDLMAYLGALWTIGHHDLPIFTVIHNNGSLYNSTEHRLAVAEHRGRDTSFERALIGTGIHDPLPDYAAIAEAQGISGYGPVKDPAGLSTTLRAAWEDVKRSRPVVVDVLCQPR